MELSRIQGIQLPQESQSGKKGGGKQKRSEEERLYFIKRCQNLTVKIIEKIIAITQGKT